VTNDSGQSSPSGGRFLRTLGAWGIPFVPALILSGGVAWGTTIGSWAWLSGSDYQPDFSDLKQITATAGCASTDPSWSLASETCDPNGRAYNYPSIWARGFSALGLDLADTEWLGFSLFLILLVTVVLMGVLVRGAWGPTLPIQQRFFAATIWILSCVSAPYWLAIDRGNTDLLILAIVTLSCLLTIRSTPVLPGLVAATAG
jgi:hypothetical protein